MVGLRDTRSSPRSPYGRVTSPMTTRSSPATALGDGLLDVAISFLTVFEGCAPLLIHAAALARSIITVGGWVTGL